MSYLPSIAVAVVLGIASASLIGWHVLAWKAVQGAEVDQRERDFRYRQYRRRMQTSAMLGILGVAVLVGQLLLDWLSPLFLLIYWLGVVALVLWVVVLAVADMVATSVYYSRERSACAMEHARLEDELRRVRQRELSRKNGKPAPGQQAPADQ